jgi:hypothetical protein
MITTDNYFFSFILIICIHPCPKANSYTINLIGRRSSQITTDDDLVKSQKYSFSHYLSPSPSSPPARGGEILVYRIETF